MSLVVTYPGDYSNLTAQIIQDTFQKVKSVGVSISYIYLDWGEIETSNGVFNWGGWDYLIQMNQQYGLKTSVTLKIIDTNQLGKAPADLASLSYKDLAFQQRVRSFVDVLLSRYSGKISYLFIGNEIDDYFFNRRADFPAYVSFFQAIYSATKAKYPDVKIGVVSTFHDAFRNNALDLIETVAAGADLIGFSLYPQVNGAVPGDVAVMIGQMSAIASRIGKKFVITETSWSSAGFGSSEVQQSDYITKLFGVYRSNLLGAGRIEYLGLFNFYDYSSAMVNQFAVKYGLTGNADMVLFFGSTGYFGNDGFQKGSFNDLVREVAVTRAL